MIRQLNTLYILLFPQRPPQIHIITIDIVINCLLIPTASLNYQLYFAEHGVS